MSATTAEADQTNESPPPQSQAPISELQRTLPTPFLTKTYQMVEDPAVNDVISWNEEGSAFVVWRPAEFALDLLPKYFKHNNFSSFVRQLNTYGFRKIVPDRWEFSNDSFKRGEKRLLCDIHRRKISLPTVAVAVALPLTLPSALAIPANLSGSSVNLSGSSTDSVEEKQASSLPALTAGSTSFPLGNKADLADENERLRKENRELANELTQLKSICNNIFLLMSKYATNRGTEHPPPEALELMPVKRILEEAEELCDKSDEQLQSVTAPTGSSAAWYYETNPMLFGVSIGEKRYREENDCDEEHTMTMNLPEVEVKLEPIDYEAAEQQKPWVLYYPRPKRLCNENDRAFEERDGDST